MYFAFFAHLRSCCPSSSSPTSCGSRRPRSRASARRSWILALLVVPVFAWVVYGFWRMRQSRGARAPCLNPGRDADGPQPGDRGADRRARAGRRRGDRRGRRAREGGVPGLARGRAGRPRRASCAASRRSSRRTPRSSRGSSRANVGKPIAGARGEIGMVAQVFHFYAGAVDKHYGETIPVAGGVDVHVPRAARRRRADRPVELPARTSRAGSSGRRSRAGTRSCSSRPS